MPAVRNEKGQFVKGSSGNPTGFKKIPQAIKDALMSASPDALNVIIEVMKSPSSDPKDRIKCAEIILEKTFGRNFQVFKDLENTNEKLEAIMAAVDEIRSEQ